MITNDQLGDLAYDYYFIYEDLEFAFRVAESVNQIPLRECTKEQLRELKARCKRDPEDATLWANAFVLRAGQRTRALSTTTTFSVSSTRPYVIDTEIHRIVHELPNDAHKRNSVRTQWRQNIAITALLGAWDHAHPDGKTPNGDNVVAFVTDALHLCGDEHVPKPTTLKKRINRIRQK